MGNQETSGRLEGVAEKRIPPRSGRASLFQCVARVRLVKMFHVTLLLVCATAFVVGKPQEKALVSDSKNRLGFQCPEEYGIFADDYQCDKYYVCEAGIPKARLCDDGLVFDYLKGNAGHADPCDSPYLVDCGDRLELQPPTYISDFCPRRNGIFADPDPTVCHRYYTCIKGVHTPTPCTSGLHFDEGTGNCVWPKISGRQNCVSETSRCLGDFCCTGKEVLSDLGTVIPHPNYPNMEDCQKFYICLNSVTPQEGSCSLGQVFDERNGGMCNYPEYVPECEGWYRNDPRFAEYYEYVDATESTDIGNQDVAGN